VKNTDSELTTS